MTEERIRSSVHHDDSQSCDNGELQRQSVGDCQGEQSGQLPDLLCHFLICNKVHRFERDDGPTVTIRSLQHDPEVTHPPTTVFFHQFSSIQ